MHKGQNFCDVLVELWHITFSPKKEGRKKQAKQRKKQKKFRKKDFKTKIPLAFPTPNQPYFNSPLFSTKQGSHLP